MTSPLRPQTILAATSAFALTLALAACEEPPPEENENDPLGGGSLEDSVSAAEATAPDPEGNQMAHEEMREILEEQLPEATVTDTDDWWANLRDINRELQKLEVDPIDCKPFVTASALPVPSGALAALADTGDRQAAIYSFEDWEAAQMHFQQEAQGLDRCSEHTVLRDVGEGESTAETELNEVEVLSGAADAVAVHRSVTADGDTQHDLAVVLRESAVVVGVVQPLEDPLGEESAEELATELEAEAALILSEAVGEEIIAPEPEPEDDEEDEDAEGAEDSDDADTEDEGDEETED